MSTYVDDYGRSYMFSKEFMQQNPEVQNIMFFQNNEMQSFYIGAHENSSAFMYFHKTFGVPAPIL